MNQESRARPFFGERNAALLPLGIILAVACGLRVWMAFFSKATWYNTDTYIYLAMAKGILTGHPLSLQPNGFPLIIAMMERLCGPASSPAALITLNVVASSAIILLCYGIGSVAASARAGLLAAGLAAVWPNQLNYMRQILSETPATFFLVLGVYLIVARKHAAGGAALALASLVRTTLAPVAGLTFVWLCFAGRKKRDVLLYAAGVVVAAACNFALLAMHVIAPSDNTGTNALLAVQSSSTQGIRFETDSFTPAQRAHPLRTYLSFAATCPGTFAAQRFSALWELWGPWPEAGGARVRSTVSRLVIGLRFPCFLLAVVELMRRRRSALHWLLAIPVMVLTGVHTVFFSTPRFSYSAEPFVMVLCGMFLARAIWPGSDPVG